jgi:steroid delta-isomerase-like uncharacterized protein
MAVTEPPQTDSPTELVRWAFERLNEHDVSVLKQFWDDETYERFPDEECVGADAIAAYFQRVFDAVEHFHIRPVDITGSGDDVYVHWHMTGVHRGRFAGVDGTGKAIAIDGIDHFVIRDGKVVSNHVVFDQLQFATQIGLLPPTGTPADRALKGAFNLRTKALGKLRRR